MKHYAVAQNSDDWFKIRQGLPTASCFNKIVTPKGKLSAQSDDYCNLLIAELMLGESLQKFPPSYWMERGSLLEEDAARLYEYETDEKIAHGGFFVNDAHTYGASPDRIILNADGSIKGLLEIKCPAPWTHIANLLSEKIDDDYLPQVQGQLLVTGAQWVDLFSYNEKMPSSRIRTHRDEDYIAKLYEALDQFTAAYNAKLDRLIGFGMIKGRPKRQEPVAPKAANKEFNTEYLQAG